MNNDEFQKFLKEEFGKMQEGVNTSPLEDFDNLSPADMHQLIYDPFGEQSIIQFKRDITTEIYNQLGFFNMMEYLYDLLLGGKEIKLTKWYNLNTKLVTEIYKLNFTGEKVWSMKPRKVYKQDEVLSLQNAVFLLRDSLKLVKIRNQKMSLTKKGNVILSGHSREERFQHIFHAYTFSLNWGYHDGYEDQLEIQKTFGYVLYLLLQYGDEVRGESFYGNKLLKAFPHIVDSFDGGGYSTSERQIYSCLSIRCFQRFLNWFKLINITHDKYTLDGDNILFHNHLLKEVFELDKSKFQFKKDKFKA